MNWRYFYLSKYSAFIFTRQLSCFYLEQRFQCSICGNSFTQKGNLNKHIQLIHERKSIMVYILFFLGQYLQTLWKIKVRFTWVILIWTIRKRNCLFHITTLPNEVPIFWNGIGLDTKSFTLNANFTKTKFHYFLQFKMSFNS